MKKKIIGILILSLIVGALIVNHLITYATIAKTPLSVNLTPTDINGVGYGVGNPNPSQGGTSNQGEYIWNINAYDSSNNVIQKNLYCVKAEYGETWFTNEREEEIIQYNLNYDIKTERTKLLENLQNNNTANDVIEQLLTPGGGQYEQLLWILDNAYTIGSNLDEYLEKVGILKDEDENMYYNKETNEWFGEESLTEADIIAIQRMVIWYFTNGSENEVYNQTGENKTLWLNITTDGTNYNSLATISESRNNMAMYLYKYLISEAQKGASQYTAENEYKSETVPANVNTTGLNKKDGKYIVKTNRLGANYLIGPIKIEENSDLGYDIVITVTDQNNNTLNNYTYVNEKGEELSNITEAKDLVGINGGFYISVPRTAIEGINVTVSISYKTTTSKLWLQGTEDDEGIKLNAEQPLVEVTQDPKQLEVILTSKPEEFDLALRKYITAVNGTSVANTRVPQISLEALQTGTTATYNHRKDPVVVEDKDEVTYNITIYNEGNKAGYATEIIDQLPTGLVNSTNNTATVISKDKNGNEKNTYKLSYNSTLNQITLSIVETEGNPAKSLDAYTTGKLDYETIEIKCMVAQEADTKNQIILTNVAWINEAYNADDNKTITTEVGADRDSEPQTSPNVNKGNMTNYKGNDNNKSELADSNYFYKGQQDDDDFEKLVIMPVEKKFDLALFKHIAAISKDQKIEDGEYITDTGNKDGKYLRAPVVKSIDSETGKITYEQDDKSALIVEPGDYVLYTIRVYNEGELNGYASKIKDTLPVGLEFVYNNEEYNGIWNVDGVDEDGRQVVSTTWYAKGQGAEEDTSEGDANYKANLLKALNKEGEITDENPDYLDAQVLCRVVEKVTSNRVLVNYAQISDDSDEDGNPIDDVDSTPDEWIDTDDDQDIERIQVQYFDLSLRKFITSVNGKAPEISREPVVDVSNLINKTGTTAIYNHTKTPLLVQIGDKIIYTIRVYNEGDIEGCASEVKDYLPSYLTYVKDSEINTKYEWQISENGRIVTTKYLANTKLQGFNGTKLDYADLEIECIVADDAPLKQNLTNIAEISEYKYNGGTVLKDIDSTSNNIEAKIPTDEKLPSYKDEEISETYVPGNEDDDDFEKVYIKQFDLSLLKFVSKVIVIEDGKETITETGYNGHEDPEPVVKVELHKKKLNNVVVKFGYGITITNEGDIPGYATEITDYVPEGLKFESTDNPNWTDEGNNVISTRQLENVLLQPGESVTVEVIFTWINSPDNLAQKTNTAEISEDKNEYDVPDRDSTPDNKKEGEDDIDIAKVILTVSTGTAKTYFMLTLGLLTLIATGIALIKKYVI